MAIQYATWGVRIGLPVSTPRKWDDKQDVKLSGSLPSERRLASNKFLRAHAIFLR